jgi:hypothetical protein
MLKPIKLQIRYLVSYDQRISQPSISIRASKTPMALGR